MVNVWYTKVTKIGLDVQKLLQKVYSTVMFYGPQCVDEERMFMESRYLLKDELLSKLGNLLD